MTASSLSSCALTSSGTAPPQRHAAPSNAGRRGQTFLGADLLGDAVPRGEREEAAVERVRERGKIVRPATQREKPRRVRADLVPRDLAGSFGTAQASLRRETAEIRVALGA